MKLLVRLFQWAVSRGLIPPSVPQALAIIEPLKRGRTSAPKPTPVLPVEVAVAEETIKQLPPLVADLVLVQMCVRCRPGELCKITPGMIDRSEDVWEIRLQDHKTAHHDKQRVLYVGPKAQEFLTPYLRKRAP